MKRLTHIETQFEGYRVELHASSEVALAWDVFVITPSGHILRADELADHNLDAMFVAIFDSIDITDEMAA